MRHILLASAAVLGLAVAAPAFAQTTDTTGGATTAPPAAPSMPATPAPAVSGATEQAPPMKMKPHVMHVRASNIDRADTRSDIAPALPVPPLGPNATPQQFLQQAQMALQHHRSGEAQEALERAETRMLDRSTMPSAANEPDMSPMIKQVTDARDALGRRDWQQASQLIGEMLKNPNMATNGAGMNGGGNAMGNPGMNTAPGNVGAGGMNSGNMATMPASTGAPGTPPSSDSMPATTPQGSGATQPQ